MINILLKSQFNGKINEKIQTKKYFIQETIQEFNSNYNF